MLFRSNIIIALKSDMLVESTDAPKIMKPWQIARKAILACSQELVGSNPTPRVIFSGSDTMLIDTASTVFSRKSRRIQNNDQTSEK